MILPTVPYPGHSGGSADYGKAKMAEWLAELAPKSIVDVGAGQGVYREIAKQVVPHAKIYAIEVFFDSVLDHKLRQRYDDVIVADVRWLDWVRIANHFGPDVVILGDVLEHMKRAEAIELVDAITWRMVPCLVSLPVVEWPQGEIDGNPFESHVYHWSDRQFREAFAPYRGAVDGPVGTYWVR